MDSGADPPDGAAPAPASAARSAAEPAAEVVERVDAGAAAPWAPPPASAIDGPYEELALDAGRPVYHATRKDRPRGRLVAHLHGMCGAPSYACGRWIGAGTEVGVMVCPTGNARCGESPVGPPSWEAPSWMELVALMDRDLENAIGKVEAKLSRAGAASLTREGAILTGYSRGAFAAPVIARLHPNRWRALVLIEANAPLSAAALRGAGVNAVALVAGEQGTEIAGMRRTAADLDAAGFPARLFVMRRTGHLYSDDMEHVMHEALAFVLAHVP
jgi:predicted esterase